MNTRLPYIAPNKWYHRLYNNFCLRQVLAQRQLFTDEGKPSSLQPIFVTGFFRSGTSLATRLLHTLGADLGPANHLLQARNERAGMNEDGFFENYLFMEASLMAFHKMNAWGHLPPATDVVRNFEFTEQDRKDFAAFTLCGVHDDRISNRHKMDALRNFDVLALDAYLREKFRAPLAVKNPHFAVLVPWLLRKWPQARFLVCFREPGAAIRSAAQITPLLNEDVYLRYYKDLLELPPDKAIFFSHDGLLRAPQASVGALAERLHLDTDKVSAAARLVDPAKQRYRSSEPLQDKRLKELYTTMLGRAINA